MKAMKKVFAALLAVVMVLGLSVTAFAATTTGSITVKNAAANETYTAYKIFDETQSTVTSYEVATDGTYYYDTDSEVYTETQPSDYQKDNDDEAVMYKKVTTTNYSYTIATDSPWLDTVIGYMGYTKVDGKWYASTDTEHATAITSPFSGNGLKLTLSANGDEYVVTTTDAFSAASFANTLYSALYGYEAVADGAEFDSTKTYYVKNGNSYSKCVGLTAFADGVTYYTQTSTELLNNVSGTQLTYDADKNEASKTDLALGYYFVTSSVGSLANLTTTNPDVVIYDKNEVAPFDKTVDDHDVEIGQTVTYTITGKVPSTTGYTTYTYKVSDTLSEGLTFNKDVVVEFGTTTITPTTTELVYNTAGDGFVLTFDMTGYQDYVDQEITITYTAVVNEKAVVTTDGNKNTATLEYSNNPDDSTSTNTETDEEKVYTVDLTIDKYATNADDENDKSTKLSGAEFILVKKDADGKDVSYYQATVYAYTYADSSNETVTVYSKNGTDYYTDIACTKEATVPQDSTPTKGKVADVSWVDSISEATKVTTDVVGAASFDGLEAGLVEKEGDTGATYYLRETKAPDGYNLLTADVPVEIKRTETKGSEGTVTVAISGDKVGVANSAGTELPSTGGIGTTIFYVVGTILVLGAAILLITKKRMSGKQE